MTPRKKRKCDSNAVAFGEVLADLDLEISLRERMVNTVESRIAWALILQESLGQGRSSIKTSFRGSIFDTLSAIEEPLQVLFPQQSFLSPQLNLAQSTKPTNFPSQQTTATAKNSNLKFLYIRSTSLDSPYDTNCVQTYILRCPTCSRQTFTSLQGLLNHARISHGLEWGTHDECVRACAMVDPTLDVGAGIEVGLGPNGLLPGLRSIFQMAVGVHRPQGPEARSETSEHTVSHEVDVGAHLNRTLGLHQDTPALAPFLGKQAVRRGISVWDTSDELIDIITTGKKLESNLTCSPKRIWYMPFKHRSSVARSTDKTGVDPMGLSVNNGENNPPSSTFYPQSPSDESHTKNQDFSIIETSPGASNAKLPASHSRFHFTTRIVLTDRSLWISPDKRQETNGHTHKWMLSVESPSYSHDITTILKSLQVTPLFDSQASLNPITKSGPLFTVVGTTDRPFLARVELIFNGVSSLMGQADGQRIILEHWVELDLLKSSSGALGEEQVVDIELDKRTILSPPRPTSIIASSKGFWNIEASQSDANGVINQDQSTSGDKNLNLADYSRILSLLVREFPMTQKDAKSARLQNANLPYKLVGTPSQLRNLVHGRRKAIEWGRARALQIAYSHEINTPKYSTSAVIPLTIGDVFSWLTEQGHFSKPPSSVSPINEDTTQALKQGEPSEIWCPICGQYGRAHLNSSTIKKEAGIEPKNLVKMEHTTRRLRNPRTYPYETHDFSIPIPCNMVPVELQFSKLPKSSVGLPIRPNGPSLQHNNVNLQVSSLVTRSEPPKYHQPATVISSISPTLTLGVRKIISSLNLPSFKSESFDLFAYNESSGIPRANFGIHNFRAEQELAPHAMVALATKCFIRALIEKALEVRTREKAMAMGLVAPSVRKKQKTGQAKSKAITLLTPAHILSSIMTRRQGQDRDELAVAIAGCLAKLGTSTERHNLLNDGGLDIQSEGLKTNIGGNGEFTVKMEPS